MNLKELTVEELQKLINDAQEEINLRTAEGKGFAKEFEVAGKAICPCTYNQIKFAEKLAEKTGSEINTTSSQLLKRFEMEDMSEAIDLMKDGKRILIS